MSYPTEKTTLVSTFKVKFWEEQVDIRCEIQILNGNIGRLLIDAEVG